MMFSGHPGSPRLEDRGTAPNAGPHAPIADWDLLFRAVQSRLQGIAESGPLQAPGLADLLRECVTALDQLRRAALSEFARDCRAPSAAHDRSTQSL